MCGTSSVLAQSLETRSSARFRKQGGDDQTAAACARPHPCTICKSCKCHRRAVTGITRGTDTEVAKGTGSKPQQIHQEAEPRHASLAGKPARCILRTLDMMRQRIEGSEQLSGRAGCWDSMDAAVTYEVVP